MFFDFIEVGTSDFMTLIQKANNDTRGLSIDALQFYLDRLPNKENCQKICAAISDKEGSIDHWWISLDSIKKYDLPNYLRGCNSIGSPHPTALGIIKERGLPENIFQKTKARMTTLNTLMDENSADGVYYLKIDTEGHDGVILKSYLSQCSKNRLPSWIEFETNRLSDKQSVNEIHEILYSLNYDLIKTGNDSVLRLNLAKRSKNTVPSVVATGLGYYIPNSPNNYSKFNLPHHNSLAAALVYAEENACSGITYQDGIYQVRNGKYLEQLPQGTTLECKSWYLI